MTTLSLERIDRAQSVRVGIAQKLTGPAGPQTPPERHGARPSWRRRPERLWGVDGKAKRAFDIFAAGAGLVALAPVFAAVALAVKLSDGGPALYGHTRVGRRGRKFKCWKFRSMVMNGDAVLKRHLAENPIAAAEWERSRKLVDDPRVTRLGRFLRKSSLDELPQLWNVIVGDMSLVGPRPVTAEELDRYGAARKYYLAARPGVTGLWQVSGRSSISYERRVRLDRSYVREWSFAWDVSLLFRTIGVLLKREGAC